MDQKTKDKLKVALFIGGFISIIGLLMAWNDGYLDGTIIADILSVLLPLVLVVYLVVVLVTWIKEKMK